MAYVEVVIPVYDDAKALYQILRSYSFCSVSDFTVHVVNDGGPHEMENVIERFKLRMNVRYHYLWPSKSKSKLSRMAAARNAGLRFVKSKRVLFTDGDCLVEPGIISAHARLGSKKLIGVGLRRMLTPSSSASIRERVWDLQRLFVTAAVYSLDVRLEGIELSNGEIVALWPKILCQPMGMKEMAQCVCWTCHCSYPTRLLKQLGGFWEEMEGWGGEDDELAIRAIRAGCKVVGVDSCVSHLHHEPQPRHPRRVAKTMRESAKMRSLVRNGGPIP